MTNCSLNRHLLIYFIIIIIIIISLLKPHVRRTCLRNNNITNQPHK